MTAAARKKPSRRSVETDAFCAASGPYDDLFEMYGALTIAYEDGKPVLVNFDPWDDRVESAELTVQGFAQTPHQTRVRCEEGHWWKFEPVEDEDNDDE